MRRYYDVLDEVDKNEEELLKKAEMSLREAGTNAVVVPPYVRDGKVFHPNLNEKGELKKRKK
jgi:ribosomal protein RSM22 (predicted rRNA methylase)